MSKFSQRYGYTSIEKAFQHEFVDSDLRVKLWNVLKLSIWDGYQHNKLSYDDVTQKIYEMAQRLWFNYFNGDMDKLPGFYTNYDGLGFYETSKEYFLTCEWYEVYDFLEAIASDRSALFTKDVREWINSTLEEYNAAYRFVGSDIVEITDSNEINAIESAFEQADLPVRTHLETALHFLSNRESPDYRNSVKESISAVEAACRLVTSNSSATLGDALKRIPNIHPAMSQAFSRLYGYTNDASGIRHSLTNEAVISYADAKFMLVACSAFISYLKASSDL